MKQLTIFLMLLCSALLLQNCEDSIPIKDVERRVKYKVTCQDPDAQVHIDAPGFGHLGLYFKGTFENEVNTKAYFAVIKATCDNPKALITVDLYIGKKHVRSVGNSPVHVSERLKGKGPYLE